MSSPREVKARASKLRDVLSAMGHQLKHSDSLEVISAIDKYRDRNRHSKHNYDEDEPLNQQLVLTLNQLFKEARTRRFEFVTIEHLLLALIDNPEAASILRACGGDLDVLHDELSGFASENTPLLDENDNREAQPTLGFQKILQRTVFEVQNSGDKQATGANILVAIVGEEDSPAANLLNKHNITRSAVMDCLSHGSSEIMGEKAETEPEGNATDKHRENTASSSVPSSANMSKELELTLNKGFIEARKRRFESMTVEHLLLALIDNLTAAQVLHACGGELDALRDELGAFVDKNTPLLDESDSQETRASLGVQRVLHRAVSQLGSSGDKVATGAHVLVAIFDEENAHSVNVLKRHNITRLDVVNYISDVISQGAGEETETQVEGNTSVRNNESSGSKKKRTLYCSFCGRFGHEVHKLILGDGVFICELCTDICIGIITKDITEQKQSERYKIPDNMPILKAVVRGAQDKK